MKSVPRLYEAFLPKHYDIRLTIDREHRTFKGSARLTGTKPKSGSFQLHAKDLVVHSATVDGEMVETTPGSFDSLTLHDTSPHGDKVIDYTFSGQITDTMHGLYPCYYDHDGEKKELLMTQFESHYAREVFPCIDEPEAKATFQLTIETEKDITVLSNTPVHSRDYTEQTTVTTFEVTPRMSTYLLAFVAGELHRVHSTSKNGTEVSIYAVTSHETKDLAFSLDIALRAIDFFEEYFDIPYPLAKSDHIAVPDFSAGAMENWGLITYRERALIVNEKTAQSTKELVASVICHELSHQWFGNLVTMRWWDDLWLNESFANMMEYVAVDALEPQWKIWQHFATHETAVAINRDYIAGVQPVKTAVHHPDEITTLFDPAIVYAKGSRLLRMLQSYVGDTAFRKGLHHYFKTHAYGNTTSDDLWRSLSTQTNKDIPKFMAPWLTQSGFPVVTVHATEKGYRLTQERLLVGGHDEKQRWSIPLATQNKAFPELFSGTHLTVENVDTMPLLNKNNDGHYIVNYDEHSLSQIVGAIDKGDLSTVDRLARLFETLILMKCGRVTPAEFVQLLTHYKNETEEAVWSIIAFSLQELDRYVCNTPYQELLQTYTRDFIHTIQSRISMQNEDDENESMKKLRSIVYQLQLYSHDESYRTILLDRARREPLHKLEGELRSVLFSVVAQHGTREEFGTLLALHNKTNDPQVRQDALDALSTSKDSDHIALLLHQLTNKEHVKPQDMLRWYVGLMKNSHARDDTWEWLKRNWKYIKITFAGDKMYESFPRYTASAMNSREEYKEYRAFFQPQMKDPALVRIIEIGLHELEFRSKLIEKEKRSLFQELKRISQYTTEK